MRSRLNELRRVKKTIKKKLESGAVEEVVVQESVSEEEIVDEEDFQDEFDDQYEQEDNDVWEDVAQAEIDSELETGQKIEEESEVKQKKQAFLGNNKKLNKGQYLQFDNKAYDMLHRLTTQWPCLSIDFIISENPFDNQKRQFQEMNKYPYQIYTVSGTQGEKSNYLYLAKWSKLHKTKYDDQSQDYEDQQDDDILNDQQPQITLQSIESKYAVNRLKTWNYSPIVAYWNQNAQVTITNLTTKFRGLKQGLKQNPKDKQDKLIFKQSSQGYAINWNPNTMGQLITGNTNGQIYLYDPTQGFSSWKDHGNKYVYHKGSVQDVQFSPSQSYAFATCSTDGTLQIVDMRTGNYKKSQLSIKAHDKDINVLDWNGKAKHLIATGSDDCSVKVWDLRKQSKQTNGLAEELICFNWHNEPITSIAFQPNQQSVLAVASEDNRLSIWDLSVENEQQQENQIPNQMMFLHQGQEDIKEIRYHPIYYEMLTSTALNGINTFKPSFVGGEEESEDEVDNKKQPIRQQDLEQYLSKLSLK